MSDCARFSNDTFTDNPPENAGRDAEAFAKYVRRESGHLSQAVAHIVFRHAGRSTITKQDILLLARRNESLDKILRQTAELGASTSR